MSVVSWDFTSEQSVRSLRNGQEITRPLTIFVDNDEDTLDVLKRDIPDLQRWQPHPDQTGFFVDEFSADKVRGTLTWSGTVRWTDTFTRNPLDEPAKLTGIRSEKLPSATSKDRRGQAILNTASELVAPIPKNEQVRIFTFQKNVSDLIEELFDFEDVINKDAVKIRGKTREPRTLLLGKVEFSDEQEVEGTTFRVCTVELAYRKSTWLHKHPSQGFTEVFTVEKRDALGFKLRGQTITERRPILLADGSKPTEPQMLDASGRWIPEPKPEDIHIIETELLEEVSFNSLLQLIAQ